MADESLQLQSLCNNPAAAVGFGVLDVANGSLWGGSAPAGEGHPSSGSTAHSTAHPAAAAVRGCPGVPGSRRPGSPGRRSPPERSAPGGAKTSSRPKPGPKTRIASQSEVIGGILSEDSPCCGGPNLAEVGRADRGLVALVGGRRRRERERQAGLCRRHEDPGIKHVLSVHLHVVVCDPCS